MIVNLVVVLVMQPMDFLLKLVLILIAVQKVNLNIYLFQAHIKEYSSEHQIRRSVHIKS